VLHRGSATDRFIAEWWVGSPHVARRVGAGPLTARDGGVAAAPELNPLASRDPWDLPGEAIEAPGAARLLVRVPARFSDMQAERPDLAQAWRAQTRTLFTRCFAEGYRAVDFFKDDRAGGAYLLSRQTPG
jgi:predicted GNAT superfamily acetyltransferase